MKLYYILLFFCMSINIHSNNSSSGSKVNINLPTIYIKNNEAQDKTLQSITIFYNYANSAENYSVTTASSITIPSGKTYSISTAMLIDSDKTVQTPKFNGVEKITLNDGSNIIVSGHLTGLDPHNPISIKSSKRISNSDAG